jgi:hypothetical protein
LRREIFGSVVGSTPSPTKHIFMKRGYQEGTNHEGWPKTTNTCKTHMFENMHASKLEAYSREIGTTDERQSRRYAE